MSTVIGWQDYARSKHECAPEYASLWDGLVGLWAPALGPTGNVVFDLSGRNNHGTLVDMPPDERWIGGEDGSALYCNGLAGYVDTPVVPSLWTGFSFLAVCTSLATGEDDYTLAGNAGAIDAQEVFYLRHRGMLSRMAFALKLNGVDTWRAVTSWVTMPAGRYVLVGTYDGATIRLYQNGALVGSGSYAGTINSTTYNIELGHWRGSRFWYGNISMAAVWSRGLSEQEVKTLTADPYCLLRPAAFGPELWYSGGAPPAGSSIPAIYDYYRRLRCA